ncbi:MAG: SOS response-associated peptidase [Nitrospiraceae bacterium]|nr:SOS response-associated peptidase [Nitrospiraceae bacterium]
MCGRFTQSVSLQDVIDKYRLSIAPDTGTLTEDLDTEGELRANYNLAPTEPALTVRGGEASRILSVAHFGRPVAFRSQPAPKLLINARSETVLSKPSFSRSVRMHRAAVPANGYFEWMKEEGTKTPYFIHATDEQIVSLAALWFEPDENSPVETFVILTQAATVQLAHIHDRMPVMIGPDLLDPWLETSLADKTGVASLMEAVQADTAARAMEAYAVTRAVSRADFKSSQAIVPAEGRP